MNSEKNGLRASAEEVLKHIYILNQDKNIDIDIIQEGYLKHIIDEESNSVLFIEESRQTSCEKSTILSVTIQIEKNDSCCLFKKTVVDPICLEVVIEFNVECFCKYQLTYSKLHRCHNVKLKSELGEITKRNVPMKEGILHVFHLLQDADFQKCSCGIEENSPHFQEKNTSSPYYNWFKKEYYDPSEEEKNGKQMKREVKEGLQENAWNSSLPENQKYEEEEEEEEEEGEACNASCLKEHEEKKKDPLKDQKSMVDSNKKTDHCILNQLTMEDVKEMSNFLSEQNVAENPVKEKKIETEEEKQKKRRNIINATVPFTVMLANKGNEICKNLIEKYSRYYREFKEERILGSGGFGYVVKVKERQFNITYALKKIPLENNKGKNQKDNHGSINKDPLCREDSHIMEEAIMIAKLHHENIVRYYDAWVEKNIDFYALSEIRKFQEKGGFSEKTSQKSEAILSSSEQEKQKRDKKELLNYFQKNKKEIEEDAHKNDNYLYILMEYCPGKTLREAIDRGVIHKNEKLIWALCKQILKGISYIHEMKIIHRDIKPSNIFLQITDNVLTAKIGDFGLTTRIDSGSVHTTAGTVHYISPEQLNGEPLDQKADLFSIGVVFFEMFHEPFSTAMERSIVLSNLLKGIFPEYMKASPKKLKFLSSLLALNPQDRSDAYSLLHNNLLCSFEKDFTEIYNLIQNRRHCEEVHTIIHALFERQELAGEEVSKNKKTEILSPSVGNRQIAVEDMEKKNRIHHKKKMIDSYINRGALYLLPPLILMHKYYIDLDQMYIEDCNTIAHTSRKKDYKSSDIYINTSKNKNVQQLYYVLDRFSNVLTVRPSFFLSMSEYVFHNMGKYNWHNEGNFFFKFYTYGNTYKTVLLKNKQFKKEEGGTNYPEETEKLFYSIVIHTKHIYEQEELQYLSIFANSDVMVSLSSMRRSIPPSTKLLLLWSYIDLLPLILLECFQVPGPMTTELSMRLRKNSFLLSSKSGVLSFLQKYKIPNASDLSVYIFELAQIECLPNQVEEYLNSLHDFLIDLVHKNWAKSTVTSRVILDIEDDTSKERSGEKSRDRDRSKERFKERAVRKQIHNMEVFQLLEKIRKINDFINTSNQMDHITFDLFLNFEEHVFSDEVVFYVISECKNMEILAYGGNFDHLIKRMNQQNRIDIKCYGVEIYLEKVLSKVVESSEKGLSNLQISTLNSFNLYKNSTACLDCFPFTSTQTSSSNEKNEIYGIVKSDRINRSTSSSEEENEKQVFQTKDNRINSSNSSNVLTTKSTRPKVLIHVERANTLIIAMHLSKQLLNRNIPSYMYFDFHDTYKRKHVKNFRKKQMKFIITFRKDDDGTQIPLWQPIQFNDIIYKIHNLDYQEYNYLRQDELINYILKNV